MDDQQTLRSLSKLQSCRALLISSLRSWFLSPRRRSAYDNYGFYKQGRSYRPCTMWGSKSEKTGVGLALGKLQATELSSMTTMMSQECYMDLSF
jgi:hypothetical protein